MARVGGFGPLLGFSSADAAGWNFGAVGPPLPRNSPDATMEGFGFTNYNNVTMNCRFGYDAVVVQLESDIFVRFWFRIRRYPQIIPASAEAGARLGEVAFYGTQASIQGGPNTVVRLTSGGEIKWYNTGNLLEANWYNMLTSPQLALNTWYRIDLYTLVASAAGRVQLRVWSQDAVHSWKAGVMLYDSGSVGDPLTSHAGEGINSTGQLVDVTFGRKQGTVNTGGVFDLSNGAIDNGAFPVDSHWTMVPVVGLGTYRDWTGGNPSWQARNDRRSPAPNEQITTTVAGLLNRSSFLMKSLRESGITGTILQYRIAVNQTSGTGGSREFIRINGINYETVTVDFGNLWNNIIFATGPPLSPDDVIEIGFTAGANAGTHGRATLALLVEHDSPLPVSGLGADVEASTVSWTGTGTGTGQTVALPFAPEFVLWWPRTTVVAGGCWWDTMRWAHINSSIGSGQDVLRVIVDPVTLVAVLNIVGGTTAINDLGVVYEAMIVRDRVNRSHGRGIVHLNDPGTPVYSEDNVEWTIGELTMTPGLTISETAPAVLAVPNGTTWEGVTDLLGAFAPEALHIYGESELTNLTAYFRGPAEVGDRSLPWTIAGPVANQIQALRSYGMQLGGPPPDDGAYQTNATSIPFLALRTTKFYSETVMAIATWKGNGSGGGLSPYSTRTIALVLGGRVPEWVIVFHDATVGAKFLKYNNLAGGTVVLNAETNQDTVVQLDGSPTETAQTVTAPSVVHSYLKKTRFYLRKVGSPTGSILAKVYPTTAGAPTGVAIGVSDAIDVSTLTTSFQWIDFEFTGDQKVRLSPGGIYGSAVAYTGTLTDYVEVGKDSTGVAAGNRYDFTGVWTSFPAEDLIFEFIVERTAQWSSGGGNNSDAVIEFVADGIVIGNAVNNGTLQDRYAESNFANSEPLDGSPTETAQTFTSLAAGGVLSAAQFWLRKTGAPTGTMVAKLYATTAGAPTGAALATSDTLNVADLRTDFYQLMHFQFTGVNKITLSATTVYAIAIAYTGTATDFVDVGQDNTAPTHAGTKYNFTGVWTSDTEDLIFYVFSEENIIYTVMAWASGIDGAGVLPPGTWHQFLVAGHAVKSIDSWYVGGVRQPTSSAEGDPETEAYFLVPGYSAWGYAFGSTVNTHTINGHTYTVIFIKEGGNSPLDIQGIISGDTPLTINVQGVETVGDGSGTLIENSLDIYYHFLKNWLFGDYQSGLWLPVETFPDTEGVPVIDAQSFTDSQNVSLRRIATGYLGAGGFGLDGAFIDIRETIRILNVSCDVDAGLNRKCQFFVSMTDDSVAALQFSPMLTDVDDIKRGTFDISDDFSNHFNVIPYLYAKDYVEKRDLKWRSSGEARSQESIDGYDDTLTMPDQELWFVRDSIIAADITHRKLVRHKDPPRLVQLSVPAKGFNIELGDVRLIQHYAGIGLTGWSAQPLRVQRHTANLNDDSVQFECFDMSRLFETIFILGNEITLAPLWATAPALDRVYGYLADDVTGLFSDGEPGKRVR